MCSLQTSLNINQFSFLSKWSLFSGCFDILTGKLTKTLTWKSFFAVHTYTDIKRSSVIPVTVENLKAALNTHVPPSSLHNGCYVQEKSENKTDRQQWYAGMVSNAALFSVHTSGKSSLAEQEAWVLKGFEMYNGPKNLKSHSKWYFNNNTKNILSV